MKLGVGVSKFTEEEIEKQQWLSPKKTVQGKISLLI